MNILLLMIPLSLFFLIIAAGLFFWAVNNGQFDDMDSPSLLPISDNLPDQESEPIAEHSQQFADSAKQADLDATNSDQKPSNK